MSKQEMNNKLGKFITAIGCIILSGVLFYYSTGFHHQWFLLWFAPILPLWYSYKYSRTASFSVAFFSFFIGTLNLLAYVNAGLPVQIIMGPIIISSLVFATLVIINAQLTKHLNHWIAIFLFPALWTSYEFIISLFAPSGPLNSLAYSQIDFLPFVQIANITGIWGITFMLLLFSSSISYGIYFNNKVKNSFFGFIFSLAMIGASIAYGASQLDRTHTPIEVLRVGAASIQAPIDTSEQNAINLTKRYVGLVDTLSAQGAQFIVLPERFVSVDSNNIATVTALLVQAAKKNHITLVVGMARENQQNYNSAMVINPNGQIIGMYNKQHLVPVLESRFKPGKKLFIINNSNPVFSWGVAICKDMDFTHPALSYGKQHVALLLVPAFDFNADAWLHAKVAIMRGIENGYAVVRAANQGLLTVSNQYGKMIALKSDVDNDETTLITTVNLYQTKTLYSILGNWFGWCCIIIVFLLGVRAYLKRNRVKK